MENRIFREKSIERVTSPEQLNDYVKVSNPDIWMVLLSIFILLSGALLWAQYSNMF